MKCPGNNSDENDEDQYNSAQEEDLNEQQLESISQGRGDEEGNRRGIKESEHEEVTGVNCVSTSSSRSDQRITRKTGLLEPIALDERGRSTLVEYGHQGQIILPKKIKDKSRQEESGHANSATLSTCNAYANTPISFEEAIASKDSIKWRQAMDEEMSAHQENGTWELVDLPQGAPVIDNKFVYMIKTGQNGENERYKARLVARGFQQRKEIDYQEVFAPVVRYETVRILLAIVAIEDMEIIQFDVKTAYLYGKIDADIYMRQPVGYKDTERPNKVCKLKRALYELKQAGRCWNRKFVNLLRSLGFKQCEADPCIFIARYDSNEITYMMIYVDDGLIMSSSKEILARIIDELNKAFTITYGEVNTFVGMEIRRNRDHHLITISQGRYIQYILSKFGMSDARAYAIPMTTGLQPVNTYEEGKGDCDKPFAEVIGSLMFAAVVSRPDIAFAVNLMSRYISVFNEEHWKIVKHIMRYLSGTKHFGLALGGKGSPKVIGYTDADYAGDIKTRRSTSGFVFTLNETAITWMSQRQPIVALSTMEAKYIALTQCTKEAIWLTKMLEEILY